MKKTFAFVVLLLSTFLFCQELKLSPSTISIETLFDYKNNKMVTFRKTKFDFERTENTNIDPNIYCKVDIDSLIDNEGRKYNTISFDNSYDNQSNRIDIEFDSLSKTANSINVYGKINLIDRLDNKSKIVIKYSEEKVNKLIYESENGKFKIYLLDINQLKRLEQTNPKSFENILTSFQSDNPFSLDFQSKFNRLEINNDEIIFLIFDINKIYVKANLINSKNEIINNEYSSTETADEIYTFITLGNSYEKINKKTSAIEILINENVSNTLFKLENIKIP